LLRRGIGGEEALNPVTRCQMQGTLGWSLLGKLRVPQQGFETRRSMISLAWKNLSGGAKHRKVLSNVLEFAQWEVNWSAEYTAPEALKCWLKLLCFGCVLARMRCETVPEDVCPSEPGPYRCRKRWLIS